VVTVSLVAFLGCSSGPPASIGRDANTAHAPSVGAAAGARRSQLTFHRYPGLMGGPGFELSLCSDGGMFLKRFSSGSSKAEWFRGRVALPEVERLGSAVDALDVPGEIHVCPDGADFGIGRSQPPLGVTECADGIASSRFGPVYTSVLALVEGDSWQPLVPGEVEHGCEPHRFTPDGRKP
jgi:hypothetical protein